MTTPDPVPGLIDVATAIRLVTAAAYEVGDGPRQTCPTCGDEDWQPKRRTVVHTRRGGFGADNDLDPLLEELRAANTIVWRDSMLGPVVYAVGTAGRVSIDVNERPLT